MDMLPRMTPRPVSPIQVVPLIPGQILNLSIVCLDVPHSLYSLVTMLQAPVWQNAPHLPNFMETMSLRLVWLVVVLSMVS